MRRGVLTPFQVNEIFNGRAAGLVLGQYLLLDRIGAGGMGAVYKARHRVLDRLVALKVIRDEYVSRPEAVERFRRECRAAARLAHPNIILVHDAHQAGAVHFLAMEYVEGKDLGRVLKERGPLPAAEACEYARQAALGLQHAHERGLVHRDVKPANLILTADGATVKVLDLGLARLRAAPGAAEADPGLTRDGAIMGTPDYLPPEQAGGDSGLADARADVYSLGCTLYHLIAGRPPFTGQTQGQKIAAHLTQEAPSLDRVRPGLPVGLPAVVRRMMAKEPAARFPTAAATAAALAPFCGRAAAAATMAPAPPMATPLAPAAPRTAVPAGRLPDAIPIGSTLPQTPSVGRPPAAASASTVAWRRPIGRKRFAAAAVVLFAVGLAALLLWRLSPTGGRGSATPDRPVASKDADPAPDHRDGPAKVVNPVGPAVPIVPVVVNLPPPPKHVPTRDGVAWPSPDCVALLGDDSGRHWGEVDAVAFRPDGKIVAAADQAAGKAFIHFWDAETLRERAAWAPAGMIVMDMAFSPDGRRFAAACGDGVRLWDAGPDGLSGERLFGAPGPSSTNIFHLLFTADGQFLLTWDAAGAVRRWRLTKGAPDEDGDPAPGPKNPTPLAISADGRVEAYCRYEAATRKTLVCVRGLFEKDGNERTVELSTGAGRLALSADGKRLAAMVGSFGAGELRVWDLDGGDPRPRETVDLAKFGINYLPSQFSLTTDGGRVVFGVSPRGGRAGVWLIDATSGDATKLEGLDVSPKCVACAADGKAVAVVGRDNRLRLWEDRGKGFAARPSGPAAAGVVRRLAFRPGGADLAVVSRLNDKTDGNTDLSNLVVWDWAKGEARQMFTCGGWFGDGAYSPDGAWLFVGGNAQGNGGPGVPFRTGFLRVWRADTLKEEAPAKLPKELGDGPIDAVTFDRAGKTLALLGGNDFARQACVCDPWPFRARGKPFAVGSRVESLALTPDGATAAVLGARGQGFMAVPVVKWWDVKNLDSGPAKEVAPANPLEGASRETGRRLTFSPDGGTLAALVATGPFPGDAHTFLLWDVKTGRTRAPAVPMGKQAPQVDALAFSPDGHTLATAEADGRVSLWRSDALTPARTWEFPGPVTAVAFSPDGGCLAVGDGDGTVAVLKLPAK